jgi:hypothetical protein
VGEEEGEEEKGRTELRLARMERMNSGAVLKKHTSAR